MNSNSAVGWRVLLTYVSNENSACLINLSKNFSYYRIELLR